MNMFEKLEELAVALGFDIPCKVTVEELVDKAIAELAAAKEEIGRLKRDRRLYHHAINCDKALSGDAYMYAVCTCGADDDHTTMYDALTSERKETERLKEKSLRDCQKVESLYKSERQTLIDRLGEVFVREGVSEDPPLTTTDIVVYLQQYFTSERKETERLRELIRTAYGAASGELQVAEDDTDGMAWVASLLEEAALQSRQGEE